MPYNFIYDNKQVTGIGFAIWIVDNRLKNSSIGLYLRKEMENMYDISYSIGINEKIIDTYTKLGYNYHSNLNRYVVALNATNYRFFLLNDIDISIIQQWIFAQPKNYAIEPCDSIEANYLESLYMANVVPFFAFLPYKNNSFWQWRYIQNEGYNYTFFNTSGGVIITRVDYVYYPQDKRLHNLKCLRIIEIIPSNINIFIREDDDLLFDAITRVIAWGRETGCVLADFQISNSRYEYILNKAGFIKQDTQQTANITRLFAPYKSEAKPLNYAYKINIDNEFHSINKENTYFLKSDGDMDRPNWLG